MPLLPPLKYLDQCPPYKSMQHWTLHCDLRPSKVSQRDRHRFLNSLRIYKATDTGVLAAWQFAQVSTSSNKHVDLAPTENGYSLEKYAP